MAPFPFRSRYLRHEEISDVLQRWAREHPSLVRVTSIGTSPEGRDLLVAEIGPDPDRKRPAAWIDGNMHAVELCGSSVALAIAEDVLALHLDDELPKDHPASEFPPHLRASLRETLLYVMPRISPDGAEATLRDGRYLRSTPRDARLHAPVPRWERSDVDGDGHVLMMRKRDPSGEYVAHPTVPGLMLARTIEDEGPFYKVWPEGTIAHFDGTSVPDPHYLSDNDVDLNRNFPFDWRPEHDQAGAGAYPTSEPETRAVVDFHTRHPNVFFWLNLHTYGGVYIRPLGDAPDKKMDASERALFRHIESICETHGGYPMVSGFEEFLYEPDKPLRGDLIEFAYNQRGCVAYVCELWDIFHRLGVPRMKPFVDHYAHLDEKHVLALAALDRTSNAGRMFQAWRAFQHPQLGEVEIGGVSPLVGLYNPPYEILGEICTRQSAAFLRVMALAPRLALDVPKVERIGDDVARVTVRADNLGYLPSYVLSSAKRLSLDARVFLEAQTLSGNVAVAPNEARLEIGHLDGWGRGRYNESPLNPSSRGTVSSRTVTLTARGHGRLGLRASGLRTGAVERVVEL
jgi:hypothetical protein